MNIRRTELGSLNVGEDVTLLVILVIRFEVPDRANRRTLLDSTIENLSLVVKPCFGSSRVISGLCLSEPIVPVTEFLSGSGLIVNSRRSGHER